MSHAATISETTREFLSEKHRLFIDGEWVDGNGGIIDCVNPANGEIFNRVTAASVSDTEKAIDAARRAFNSGVWHSKTPAERAKTLWKIADLIDENAVLLAELETLDGGKLYPAALNGEVAMAAESFRYYAGWATKLEGKTTRISSAGDMPFHCYSEYHPVGVVGAITPWNGALVMAAWKLAPALAAGCSCVLKPSEQTNLSTLALGQLIEQAGIPAGVVNIVPGFGHDVGATIANSPLVDKISFTGSTATGKKLLEAAKGNLKKLTLELGGKSPAIVLDDADLEKAVPGIAGGIFSNAGQVCVAGSRLYVDHRIHDDFVARLVDYASKIEIGNGFEQSSEMGPVISQSHLDSIQSYVNYAVEAGANIACGGAALDTAGFYFPPTILTNVNETMQIAREEVFGPVLVVQPFENIDDVTSRANNSDYGLAASVWSQDIGKAHALIRKLEAGITWVNAHGIPDMAVPFGGFKQSGWGREGGLEGLLQYCELRSTLVNLT